MHCQCVSGKRGQNENCRWSLSRQPSHIGEINFCCELKRFLGHASKFRLPKAMDLPFSQLAEPVGAPQNWVEYLEGSRPP